LDEKKHQEYLAEPIEAKHVEQDVPYTRMYEHIGDDGPRLITE
jgi:hypothetical protein